MGPSASITARQRQAIAYPMRLGGTLLAQKRPFRARPSRAIRPGGKRRPRAGGAVSHLSCAGLSCPGT